MTVICTSLRNIIDWLPLGHATEMAESVIKKGGPVNFFLCFMWMRVIKP